jgi:hypothetical protein
MQNETENKYAAAQEYYDMLIHKLNEAIAAYSLEVLKDNSFSRNLKEYGTMLACGDKLHQFKQQEYWRHVELQEFKKEREKVSENPV